MHLFRSARRYVARTFVAVPLLAVMAMLGGCIDGVDGPTIDDTGAIELEVSQPKATIATGMPAVSAVTIQRLEGYEGTVLLSADSLPTGVTVSFDPSALGGAATTSIMTITAASNATVGVDTINLRASGVNVGTDSLKVEVRVEAGALALTVHSGVQAPQGTTGSAPLSIARTNGFAGAVNLLAEGLPANVTATFTPALLPNGTVGSTLLLGVGAGAVPGNYDLTIRAKGPGVPDKTAILVLQVLPGAAPEFSMSASPAAFSVVAGSTAQSTISISRSGGHTGAVTFAGPAGLPNGLTATLTPNPAVANTTTLSVTAGAATAPGTYNLQFLASSQGLASRLLTVVVTVTPLPGVKVDVAPAALRIAPGGFAQAVVLLTRVAGFTGDFVMSAENLPAGLTASFAPAPVIGTATTLTLAATAATAPGTYNIVVKATAGSDFGTFTVPVTVATSALRQQ